VERPLVAVGDVSNRPSADIDAPQIEEARRIQILELPVLLGRVRRSVLRTIESDLEIAPIMASAV